MYRSYKLMHITMLLTNVKKCPLRTVVRQETASLSINISVASLASVPRTCVPQSLTDFRSDGGDYTFKLVIPRLPKAVSLRLKSQRVLSTPGCIHSPIKPPCNLFPAFHSPRLSVPRRGSFHFGLTFRPRGNDTLSPVFRQFR